MHALFMIFFLNYNCYCGIEKIQFIINHGSKSKLILIEIKGKQFYVNLCLNIKTFRHRHFYGMPRPPMS